MEYRVKSQTIATVFGVVFMILALVTINNKELVLFTMNMILSFLGLTTAAILIEIDKTKHN